jgi:hypothetical protein
MNAACPPRLIWLNPPRDGHILGLLLRGRGWPLAPRHDRVDEGRSARLGPLAGPAPVSRRQRGSVRADCGSRPRILSPWPTVSATRLSPTTVYPP